MTVWDAGKQSYQEALKNSAQFNRGNKNAPQWQKDGNAFLQGALVPVKTLHRSKAVSRGAKALGKAGVPFAREVGAVAEILGFGPQAGGSQLSESQRQAIQKAQLVNAMSAHSVVR